MVKPFTQSAGGWTRFNPDSASRLPPFPAAIAINLSPFARQWVDDGSPRMNVIILDRQLRSKAKNHKIMSILVQNCLDRVSVLDTVPIEGPSQDLSVSRGRE